MAKKKAAIKKTSKRSKAKGTDTREIEAKIRSSAPQRERMIDDLVDLVEKGSVQSSVAILKAMAILQASLEDANKALSDLLQGNGRPNPKK